MTKRFTMPARLGSIFLFGLLTFAATGCVDRSLIIKSDPAGARVFLNGQDKGTTPATIPFDFYGTWDLQIRMEENELRGVRSLKPVRTKIEVSPPWHQRFPLDFFTDVLWPGTIELEHTFQYKLEQQDLDALSDSFRNVAEENGVRLPIDSSGE